MNIYNDLYIMFHKAFTTPDNAHIRMGNDLKEFLYVKYGVKVNDTDRNLLRDSIEIFGDMVPVNIIFLNEEQTEQWKGRYNYSPLDLVENYFGLYKTQLMVYIPDFMMYTDNDEYNTVNRMTDLAGVFYLILTTYFRNNFVLQKEKKTMCTYGSIVIALKLLYDLGLINDVKSLEQTKLKLIDNEVRLKNVEEIVSNEMKDLITNKAIEGILGDKR